ncbi:MAG: DUF3455 domain-containing protein [Leptolyngbyaceae cyanobacterium CSU_1_3]|nr:DUF3455 domain-containing protein [Leptolyngbyaceae cyanobacterium CSU_1_3]
MQPSLSFALALVGLGLLNLSAHATPDLQIPKNLQAPSDQQLLFKLAAQGSQIYECKATNNPTQFEWVLKAPDAVLLDDRGQRSGKHYGGPTWEANDGSKIAGHLQEKTPAPDQNDIPWLLLQVKSHQGTGKFSPVNWIQRVQTQGGKAPDKGCDRAHEKAEVRVSYTANYHFYGASPLQNSLSEY